MRFPRVLIIIGAAVALFLPGIQGEENQSPTQEQQIAELIARLADDRFAVRQEAQKALVKIGKPALEQLLKAARTSDDEEVRSQARAAIEQIDPGAFRRVELERRRAWLRQQVAAAKGVDATNWGESIANPFTNLTDEGRKRLKEQDVDVERLRKMRARFLTGNYCGANSRHLVNKDPNTILVVGKGFITHSQVTSAGPILAAEDAHFMGNVLGADLVWCVDQSFPRGQTAGAPLLLAPTAKASQMQAEDATVADFGWRPPRDFCKPLREAPENDPPPTRELAAARKAILEEIKIVQAVDVATCTAAVANPFTNLTDEGKAKLQVRGIDADRLARLKAVYLTGSYCGANSKTFVNNDPDTILVIGKDFITHGQVYSVGPILAVDDAHFMASVVGADVVWFVDESFPRGRTVGAPAILAPTARFSQMNSGTDLIWHGDYGWRRPERFMKPTPVPEFP